MLAYRCSTQALPAGAPEGTQVHPADLDDALSLIDREHRGSTMDLLGQQSVDWLGQQSVDSLGQQSAGFADSSFLGQADETTDGSAAHARAHRADFHRPHACSSSQSQVRASRAHTHTAEPSVVQCWFSKFNGSVENATEGGGALRAPPPLKIGSAPRCPMPLPTTCRSTAASFISLVANHVVGLLIAPAAAPLGARRADLWSLMAPTIMVGACRFIFRERWQHEVRPR